MSRMKGIMAAGTFTGLVIITVLALGFGSLGATDNSATAVPEDVIPQPVPQTVNMTADEALLAWQQYSAELEQTVRTMQDRDNTYQAQIDVANQTILKLQDQINAAGSGTSINSALTVSGHFEEREGHEEQEEHGLFELHEDYDD